VTVSLAYKPDLDEARRHWEAFWAGEIIDRPCARIVAPNDGAERAPHPPGLQHPSDDLAGYVRQFDRWAASAYFAGDAVPFFFPNFGPDIYTAFLGADLEFAKVDGTSWALPFVDDWETDGPAMDRPHGYWWEAALRYVTEAREIARGKFGIGVLDLHSNLDCLAAARGPERLCIDILDCPDQVESATHRVRAVYQPIFNALYEASGQDETGCFTWLPMYCDGRYAAIQCDFVCLISREHARRFLYPALEEEAAFLDHCCYHLDGPDALVHLDDILAIKDIDSIQWVPGAGNAPLIEWMDLLKRVQGAGKSVYIGCGASELPVYHKELQPNKVFYDVYGVASQAEADALLDWLKAHT
jgi:hypothetical protein